MNEFYVRNVLEAALLAAAKPLQLAELGQLFDENLRPSVDNIRAALDALADEYSNRGVEVKETAAGFRIQVRREFSSEISRLWPERPARYSRALLETLALIAYRQPITRAEIEAVRGVAVNPNIVKTVIERNWVRVVGHRDVPGRPELLGTTREFLDYFGLRSLDELPALAEIKAMGEYNPQLELSGAAAGTEAVGAIGSEHHDVEPGDAVAAAREESGGTEHHDPESGDAVAVARGESGAADILATEYHDLESVHAVAAGEGDSGVSDAVATRHDDLESAGRVAAGYDGSGASDAVADSEHHDGASVDAGAAADEESGVSEAVATAHESDGSDAEADRTLTSGETSHHSSESDDSETADSSSDAHDSLDALDDSADDDADEDELSADGHGSRELVAGPRDLDD